MGKRPYFTLVFNEGSHLSEPWGIAFGDYDRDTVKAEMYDLSQSWDATLRAFKIIRTTSARQADIDAAVAALNASAPCPKLEA